MRLRILLSIVAVGMRGQSENIISLRKGHNNDFQHAGQAFYQSGLSGLHVLILGSRKGLNLPFAGCVGSALVLTKDRMQLEPESLARIVHLSSS